MHFGKGRGNRSFRVESLEDRLFLCGTPLIAAGTVGDDVPDFYYTPASGAVVMNGDGARADTILLTGPQPNDVDFAPDAGWTIAYFNGKMQWIHTASDNGEAGPVRLATYASNLTPATALPCVESLIQESDDVDAARRVIFTTIGIDSQAPTAIATANAIRVSSSAAQSITVTYSDAALNVGTLGDGDLQVTGPGGYSQVARFVSRQITANGRQVTAIYSVPANGVTWDEGDNGTYTIRVSASQVSDLGENVIPGGTVVGTFAVSIGSTANSWQNPSNPLDVNGIDGVTPLDALLIINELTNREFSDPTDGRLQVPATPPPFLDTNGDGFLGPLDALLVVNALPSSTARVPSALSAVTIPDDGREQREGDPRSPRVVDAILVELFSDRH